MYIEYHDKTIAGDTVLKYNVHVYSADNWIINCIGNVSSSRGLTWIIILYLFWPLLMCAYANNYTSLLEFCIVMTVYLEGAA